MKNTNILLVGLVNSGKTTIAKHLCKNGFFEHFSIDNFREKYSDGSYAGEYRSWYRFLRIAEHPPYPKNVFEFSGVGTNKEAFADTMKSSNQKWITVYCIASEETLDNRRDIYDKKLKSIETPYGDSHFDDITRAEILSLYESNYYKTPSILIETDSKPISDTIKEILESVNQ